MKRPFLPAALIMLFALLPMRMMQQTIKEADFQPFSFGSPILRAEFHTTSEDVFDLYGAEKSDARTRRIEKMQEAHRFDNFFLCVYGLFLALFAVLGFRLTGKKYFLVLIFLAFVAAVADFLENYTIAEITRALDNESLDFSLLLKRLQFFTWLKWLSLALYFGLLVRFFRTAAQWGGLRKWLSKLLILASWAVVIVSVVALFNRSAQWEYWMSQGITLLFVGLFVFSLFFRRQESLEAAR